MEKTAKTDDPGLIYIADGWKTEQIQIHRTHL